MVGVLVLIVGAIGKGDTLTVTVLLTSLVQFAAVAQVAV
jgi:hypothetical protein